MQACWCNGHSAADGGCHGGAGSFGGGGSCSSDDGS